MKNILDYTISKPWEGKHGKWYFNIKGENGQIVVQSQGYATKGNANRMRRRLNYGQLVLVEEER